MASKKQLAKKRVPQETGSDSGPLGWDVWLAILAALPLLAIALLPVLQGVPSTESAGPGWVLPLFIPAGLVLVLGPNAKRLGWPHGLLLLLALIVFGRSFFEVDTFAARRSSVVFATSALCFALGCGIDKRGRRFFLAMMAWLAVASVAGLVATLAIHGQLAEGPAFSTSLQFGNRGDLAEFLLPAVVFAVAGFLRSHHLAMGGILLTSACIVAWFLGWTPVNAGVLALFTMTVAGLLGGVRSKSSARVGRLLLLASLVCAISMGTRHWQESKSSGFSNDFVEYGSDYDKSLQRDRMQGLEVRLEIWKSTLAMSKAHPMLGVGPGQSQMAFPPYRSEAEIAHSTHRHKFRNAIEVEHAHNDYLIAIAELGWPLGLLWIGLCLWILRMSLGNLLQQDRTRVIPSLASVGLLAMAFWNAPLLGPVVSHPLAWLCFGMAMGPMKSPRSAKVGIALAATCLVLAAGQVLWSMDFLRHGWALAHGPQDARALEQALAIAPDSPLALDFAVHAVQPPKLAGPAAQAWLDGLLPQFEQLLAMRPYGVGIHNDWGRAQAIAGQYDEADKAFAHALSLDAKFTPAHTNRVRMNVDRGDLESLRTHLQLALESEAFEPSYIRSWGLSCLRNGRPEIAQVLLTSADAKWVVTDANVCHQQAQFARLDGKDAEENSFLAGEHLLFARDHIAMGAYESAVRSYRQAKRYARRATSATSDPNALRLEMAAAWTLAGKPDEAGKELEGLKWQELTAVERNGLPEWARKVLPIVPQ
ncbi:MAG: O-antigen ligase/tetratricopeptide (TPR) repeat protein [Glaciecola sp.]|jgi:O-antigen ligase/tetratricopeptide (TPR) repeat protein